MHRFHNINRTYVITKTKISGILVLLTNVITTITLLIMVYVPVTILSSNASFYDFYTWVMYK